MGVDDMPITDEKYIEFIEKKNKNLTTSELAKIYGMSSIKFNMVLQETNVIYKKKCNGKIRFFLKKGFRGKNLQETESRNYIKQNGEVLTFKDNPKWTKRGIMYLYFYLKKYSIIPKNLEGDEIENKIEQLKFL